MSLSAARIAANLKYLKCDKIPDRSAASRGRKSDLPTPGSTRWKFVEHLPGIFDRGARNRSRPARNRADASISGFTSRGDLYCGPRMRYSGAPAPTRGG